MKSIVISQVDFDRAFEELKKNLELAECKASREGANAFADLYRMFIYQVHAFKDRLEKT